MQRLIAIYGAAIALAMTAALLPASAATTVDGATPACDDPRMIRDVEFSYQAGENMPTDAGTLKIDGVKEVGLFPPPKLSNQYATSVTYVKEARFCEGRITLPDGFSEPVFWRIYYVVDTSRHYAQAEFCSPKHDVWQNNCEVYKPDAGAKPLN